MNSRKALRSPSGGQSWRLKSSATSILGAGAVAAVMLVGFGGSAMASVMDFNNLPSDPFGIVDAGATITQNGYTIHDTAAGNDPFYTEFKGAASGWQNNRGTDNGTTTVGMESLNSSTPITFTLTRQGATPFNFLSIDIGSLDANDAQFHNSIATQWTFLGNLFGGGTVSQTITTDPDNIFTYALDAAFHNLASVEITAELPVMGIEISNGAGLTADFDNIVATPYGGVVCNVDHPLACVGVDGGGGGGVPEPASWALMITGFGMAGAALRRQRATAAA
jgi:hypothetical protein